MGYEAKIIADSISEAGKRLTTVQVTFPRFILAEVNTHRALSRNSASSRAIPVEKMIQRVLDDPFIPESFLANKKGMQGGDPLDDKDQHAAWYAWFTALHNAVNTAKTMTRVGVHKQYANRLLEPFLWHTAILSATEWDNFFHQRISPMAQPEFKTIAMMIYKAMQASTPERLHVTEYHLPYLDKSEREIMRYREDKIAVSIARCARVSYLTQEGKRDIDEDLKLYKRLEAGGHWSPMEHVASPYSNTTTRTSNYVGWEQYRKYFNNENVTSFTLTEDME